MRSKCYLSQSDVARMKASIDSNQHLLPKTKEPNEVFCFLFINCLYLSTSPSQRGGMALHSEPYCYFTIPFSKYSSRFVLTFSAAPSDATLAISLSTIRLTSSSKLVLLGFQPSFALAFVGSPFTFEFEFYSDTFEGVIAELTYTVLHTCSNHKVLWFVLLEYQPHTFYIVFGISPVAK